MILEVSLYDIRGVDNSRSESYKHKGVHVYRASFIALQHHNIMRFLETRS
jgi:hypothetical protein